MAQSEEARLILDSIALIPTSPQVDARPAWELTQLQQFYVWISQQGERYQLALDELWTQGDHGVPLPDPIRGKIGAATITRLVFRGGEGARQRAGLIFADPAVKTAWWELYPPPPPPAPDIEKDERKDPPIQPRYEDADILSFGTTSVVFKCSSQDRFDLALKCVLAPYLLNSSITEQTELIGEIQRWRSTPDAGRSRWVRVHWSTKHLVCMERAVGVPVRAYVTEQLEGKGRRERVIWALTFARNLGEGVILALEELVKDRQDLLEGKTEGRTSHLDINPDNVLVPFDAEKQVTLIDWFPNHLLTEPIPGSEGLTRQRSFVAPERRKQTQRQPPNDLMETYSDIYSVGKLLQWVIGGALQPAMKDNQASGDTSVEENDGTRAAKIQAAEAEAAAVMFRMLPRLSAVLEDCTRRAPRARCRLITTTPFDREQLLQDLRVTLVAAIERDRKEIEAPPIYHDWRWRLRRTDDEFMGDIIDRNWRTGSLYVANPVSIDAPSAIKMVKASIEENRAFAEAAVPSFRPYLLGVGRAEVLGVIAFCMVGLCSAAFFSLLLSRALGLGIGSVSFSREIPNSLSATLPGRLVALSFAFPGAAYYINVTRWAVLPKDREYDRIRFWFALGSFQWGVWILVAYIAPSFWPLMSFGGVCLIWMSHFNALKLLRQTGMGDSDAAKMYEAWQWSLAALGAALVGIQLLFLLRYEYVYDCVIALVVAVGVNAVVFVYLSVCGETGCVLASALGEASARAWRQPEFVEPGQPVAAVADVAPEEPVR